MQKKEEGTQAPLMPVMSLKTSKDIETTAKKRQLISIITGTGEVAQIIQPVATSADVDIPQIPLVVLPYPLDAEVAEKQLGDLL